MATLTPAQHARYEAEYLAEKQVCQDFGISKEVFLYTVKTRDGLDAVYPGDSSEPNLSEADGVYQSDADRESIQRMGERLGKRELAMTLSHRGATAREAFDVLMGETV